MRANTQLADACEVLHPCYEGTVLAFDRTSKGSTVLMDRSIKVETFGSRPAVRGRSVAYSVFKRGFDLAGSFLLLPLLLLASLAVFALNPFLNAGPLLFVQQRMGKDCRPFKAYKFRTMLVADEIARGPFEPVEHHRIRKFGRLLRRSRLDELPQILNVIKGDMSLIGPRPDYYAHALVYLDTIPGYRERHEMRPGISGLAQTEVGYAECVESVQRKVSADLHYIDNASVKMDLYITLRTLMVVFLHRGM